MNASIDLCLFVFLALLAASLLMQWFRARKRRKLVRSVNPEHFGASDQEKWRSVEDSFDFMFKDFRKLQLLKKNLGRFSSELNAEFSRYRIFSRIEMVITLSMLLFAATAFLICS